MYCCGGAHVRQAASLGHRNINKNASVSFFPQQGGVEMLLIVTVSNSSVEYSPPTLPAPLSNAD